ncbi:TPA: helix-turn-helix domain-containing protein [Enterococcus faecium]
MKNKTLISVLRKSRGWTQERLAEESGLSVRTI